MAPIEFSKQVTLRIPRREWMLLQQEAANRKTSICGLCLKWLQPHIRQVQRQQTSSPQPGDGADTPAI